MVTRREVMLAGAAACMLGPAALRAATPQPTVRVSFDVPAGTCDCHTHVFDPARFALSPTRAFTPQPALPADMLRMHRSLGVQRVVIVTSSAYGTNNDVTMHGIREYGAGARGVVVITDDATNADLDAMNEAGVRGARLYLARGTPDPEDSRARLRALIARVRPLGWHVQIFANPVMIAALESVIADAGVPVVIDHFGGALGAGGVAQQGFQSLVALLAAGAAYVKVSAAYRFSGRSPDFPDMGAIARELIGANPDRILWASDWPHTNGDMPGKPPHEIFPFIDVDDAHLMNLFARWVPDAVLRRRIMVDNPARLYGFQER